MESTRTIQAVQMIKDGYTAQQITEALQYKGYNTVYNIAFEHGLKIKPANADRDAAIIAMRKQGVSISLIAERLNVDKSIVGTVCRKAGLGLNTIELTERKSNKPKVPRNQWADRDMNEEGRQAVEKYAPEYEYIGGYTGSDGTLVIRHKACGYTFRTSAITLRHKQVGCYLCNQIEKQKQKEKEKEAQARLIEVTRFNRPVPKYKPIQLKACPVCGAFYYAINRARYCSDECAKEARRKYDNTKKYKRRVNAQTKDSAGITARRLYIKYRGICWLCGKLCDITASPNSDLYPSVDHVKPISKGGLDSWDNVRLAHRICNSVRSNHEEITKICS